MRLGGRFGSSNGRIAMKIPRRQFLHLAAGAVALPTVSRIARAQNYPTRPVRWIVGMPPAAGTICCSHATRIAIVSAALRDDMPRTGTSCLRAIQKQGVIGIVSIGDLVTSIMIDQEFIIE
jgi:hypothetical protein